jgi:threonine dehydratase
MRSSKARALGTGLSTPFATHSRNRCRTTHAWSIVLRNGSKSNVVCVYKGLRCEPGRRCFRSVRIEVSRIARYMGLLQSIMISAADIELALPIVSSFAARSELRVLTGFSSRVGSTVMGKLEGAQPGGSYKLRGAAYALAKRTPGELARGVIAYSTGNFGRAVAIVAGELGLSCTVFVSSLVPQNKIDMLRAAGASVIVHGDSQDDAEQEAIQRARSSGAALLSPITDSNVHCGHGTLAVEIAQQLNWDSAASGTIVVPVSAGGLLSGVLLYCRERLPNVRIVGASMTRGAAMFASLLANRPVHVREEPTLADSLGGGIGGPYTPTVPLACAHLHEACLVSEEAIYDAIRDAALKEHVVCEGAAAAALAAIVAFASPMRWPAPIVALVTGANIDPQLHCDIVADTGARAEYQARDAVWRASVPDAPTHWVRLARAGSSLT